MLSVFGLIRVGLRKIPGGRWPQWTLLLHCLLRNVIYVPYFMYLLYLFLVCCTLVSLSPSLPRFHFSAFLPLSFCFMCHFCVLLFFQKDTKMSLRWKKKGLVTATDSSTSAFLTFAFLWRAVTEWRLCAFSMGVFRCVFSLFQDSSEIENLGQLDGHPGGFSGDSGGC